MSTTPGFEPDQLEALRAAAGPSAPDPRGSTGSPSSPPSRPARRSAEARVKDVVRRVIERVLGGYIRGVAHGAVADATDQLQRLASRLERLLDTYEELAALPANFELLKGEVGGLQATTVNLELLKSEVREVKDILDGVGSAIAPGVGLTGVGPRFAELRQQVNVLARQLRSLPTTATDPLEPPAGDRMAAQPVVTSSFDYVGLEHRFRGDSDEILAIAKERYLELLRDHQPVLDVGCGRGELVGALADAGVAAVGVDLDAGMVEEARARGADVHLGDAVAYLREQPAGAFGAIVSIQVVEHLPFEVLMELVEVAATRLKPGGVLILETPNPLTLYVLGNTFLLDPTHVRPIHPSLLVFLCERAGFADIEVRWESPLTSHQLPLIDGGEDAPPWVATLNVSLQRLNDVLFGPQDYAVVATTPTT